MDDVLRARVRSAYELARLRRALPWAIPALALGGLGVASGGLSVLPVAGLLVLATVGVHWLGNGWEGGLRSGLRVGAAGFGATVGWSLLDTGCGTVCGLSCTAVCVSFGAIAGLGLAALAWRSDGKAATSSVLLASLVAGLGCLPLGWSGLVMVLVMIGLTSPVIVAARLEALASS